MGFGYLLFDGLFYIPGAAGDWKTVLDLFDGHVMLRFSIMMIGTLGYMAIFFWLGKAGLSFLSAHDRNRKEQRFAIGFKMMLVPYVLSVVFNVPFAFWHPLGFPEGFFVVFFLYVFAFSGLITGFFMLWIWLKPIPFKDEETYILSHKPLWMIWMSSLMLFVFQVLLVFNIFSKFFPISFYQRWYFGVVY